MASLEFWNVHEHKLMLIIVTNAIATIVKILFFIRIAMIGCLTVQSANLGIRNVD